VVGLMYVMQLLGMIVSALVFGAALADFSPGRLVQVIQGAAVTTIALNLVALWKQETRNRARTALSRPQPTFRESWGSFSAGDNAVRRLVAVGLGTMAFSMQDVLLEPYGGQVLNMTVGATTQLTATLAVGGLVGFGLASRVLGRGADPYRMAAQGAMVGVPAFLAIILAAPLDTQMLFALGVLLVGFGGGLFAHGTLTAAMNLAPENQIGLALGAWGAVQATAAGIGVTLGAIVRDVVVGMGWLAVPGLGGPAAGFTVVYALEVALLLATVIAMAPLLRRAGRPVAA